MSEKSIGQEKPTIRVNGMTYIVGDEYREINIMKGIYRGMLSVASKRLNAAEKSFDERTPSPFYQRDFELIDCVKEKDPKAAAWLMKATESLFAAEILFRDENQQQQFNLYAKSIFNSEQAEELAIKALLLQKNGTVAITNEKDRKVFVHTITELRRNFEFLPMDIVPIDERTGVLLSLSDYYSSTRYPKENGECATYTKKMAKDALLCAYSNVLLSIYLSNLNQLVPILRIDSLLEKAEEVQKSKGAGPKQKG